MGILQYPECQELDAAYYVLSILWIIPVNAHDHSVKYLNNLNFTGEKTKT